MSYANRRECGKLLTKHLQKLKLDSKNSVICPIPRGGVAVAEPIYEKLKIPVALLVIKKIGAQGREELAIGAITAFFKPILDYSLIRELGIPKSYIKDQVAKKKKEAVAAEKKFGVSVADLSFKGKNVIVVDDGLATGQTAKLAAKIIRNFGPRQLILAVGCAAETTVSELSKVYDEIICLVTPPDFYAVGQCFRDFSPVSDQEVLAILAKVKPGL